MRALLTTVLLAIAVFAVGGGVWQHVAGLDEVEASTPALGDSDRVASVSVVGPNVPLQTARDVLTTRRGGRIAAAALEADRTALVELLIARGHWMAEVSPAEVAYGAHGAHVRWTVAPGPLYRVGAVLIEGAPARLEAELRAALTVRVGDRLTPAAIAANVALLDDLRARAGVRAAAVTPRITVDGAALSLAVTFSVR